jgi:hypothetical protein
MDRPPPESWRLMNSALPASMAALAVGKPAAIVVRSEMMTPQLALVLWKM